MTMEITVPTAEHHKLMTVLIRTTSAEWLYKKAFL
jgi:hypothetical protein